MGTIITNISQYKQPSHKELGLPAGVYVPEMKQTRSKLRVTFGNIPSCQSLRTLCHPILIGELQSPGLQIRHLKTSLMASNDYLCTGYHLCTHIFDCYFISTILLVQQKRNLSLVQSIPLRLASPSLTCITPCAHYGIRGDRRTLCLPRVLESF